MEDIEQLLEKSGLSPGESKVYLALVELGVGSVGPIAAKSRVSMSKVYEILNRLIKKGLVSSIFVERVKKFKAEDPRQLVEYISRKRDELDKTKIDLEKNLVFLNEMIKSSEKSSTTRVYEGFNGMRGVFEKSLDELKKGDIMYVLGISESTETIRNYFSSYFKRQFKIGFKVKALFDETAEYKAKERKNKFTDFRFLPNGSVTPATIVMYKDKTIIEVGNPLYILTILISNKEISDSFRNHFELLWKGAKK
ncbi:MAG: helix-turn-helix domain-containing protein [Candidatus Pacearchaeota archaeon]|jgi:sugar-specific transcriptional regulator TrmB